MRAGTRAASSPSPTQAPTDVEPAGAALTASAVATAQPSPSSSAVAPRDITPSPRAARLVATDDAPRADAPDRLAFTGSDIVGILLAAVVLITVGTLALHGSRHRVPDQV